MKRVLGYGKRFIVDYVTWTCPEPKSAGCPPGTLEFVYSQNKMAPFRDSFIVKNTTLVLTMGVIWVKLLPYVLNNIHSI